MRIAIAGATGRIGARLSRLLLQGGHDVKALSRGGPGLDALTQLGAEPCIGSFDTGLGDLNSFFQGVDAAFLMVKTDWSNIEGHYPAVARRFVDALRGSPVRFAVSLTAMGSDVPGANGHFESFYLLDRALNELSAIDLVHLQAAQFMENTLAWTESVAKYGRMAGFFEPDLQMPWVATEDIANLAAYELTHPTGEHRVTREVAAEALSMNELAAIISAEIGRVVDYRFVDPTQKEIETQFLRHSGTPEKWLDEGLTAQAINSGIVGLKGPWVQFPTPPVTMASFIRDVWKPKYLESLSASGNAETFLTWAAKP